MSIHCVSPLAIKAATILVLLGADVMLSAATAESGTQASSPAMVLAKVGESHSGVRGERAASSCRVIDRPKHAIVYCDCSSDPLASVSSVDVAAILRLFVGSPRCHAPLAARQ